MSLVWRLEDSNLFDENFLVVVFIASREASIEDKLIKSLRPGIGKLKGSIVENPTKPEEAIG
jgi:hypothetical protein